MKKRPDLLPGALAGFAGALGGTLCVAAALPLWRALAEGYLWMAVGPAVGAALGFAAGLRFDRGTSALGGGCGGCLGGGLGSYVAVACGDSFQGGAWALYGGLLGGAVGAASGAYLGALAVALLRRAFAGRV